MTTSIFESLRAAHEQVELLEKVLSKAMLYKDDFVFIT